MTSPAESSADFRRRPAVEWFLDNFYLIAETARALRKDIPPSFYHELPVVRDAAHYLPRAYVLAREFLAHSVRPPDHNVLEAFLLSFQEYGALRIGELWAFPAMLRAVCLQQIADGLHQMQGNNVASQDIRAEGTTGSVVENQDDIVSLAVRTLIALKTISWREVFEGCSLVHQELVKDPSGVYATMDFGTRDRYRHVVQELAKRVGCEEIFVAQRACAAATAHLRNDGEDQNVYQRRQHIGYYLIDQGRPELELILGVRLSFWEKLGRVLLRSATPVYLAAVGVATLLVVLPLLFYLDSLGVGMKEIVLGAVVALLPASVFAVAWTQWVITNLITPKRLPRLSMESGIGSDYTTFVVIPTLLGDLDEVHALVKKLELHYLANPDPNLRFALLADFTDATEAVQPEDEELLSRATDGITLLNQRYGHAGTGPFHLLVRERRFNSTEGVWMGWERKRGKLEEFNRLLAATSIRSIDTSYTIHVGAADGLENVQFVITLDSDTELPRDAARRLVSILAHPLNRACVVGDRIDCGYTVLQPRLDINPDASHRSRFSRIFAGDTGLDIYSRAVSDVYQDFFGMGVYAGKGIYDVDAFRSSLEGRVPENALLSHDLFEGIHGRVGLVTDVVLYEDYPANYLVYARRLHRWIRGDWQLLPWLRFRVPSPTGRRVANPFAHIDRWKVLDNLRRSLFPVALFALLLSGWTWLPGNPIVWTLVALALSSGHMATAAASQVQAIFRQPRHGVRQTLIDFPNNLYRWLIALVFLPHEAVVVVDAIARTMIRLAVTRKRLLEWTTAAHTAAIFARGGLRPILWWEMIGGPVAAVIAVSTVLVVNPAAWHIAAMFGVVWLLSPELAMWLARPSADRAEQIPLKGERVLRQLARRTWLFFESFVGPDDHWLPPDNVQLVPELRVAHRTSPTNVGLYLASCACAHDLGYIGSKDFCLRTRNTLRTLGQLERFRGQFLNWYETRTLEPLLPKYVSTVDNGNFAAALIAVRQACTYYATQPIFRVEYWSGLEDVADLLESSFAQVPEAESIEVQLATAQMRAAIMEAKKSPETWMIHGETLAQSVVTLSDGLRKVIQKTAAPSEVEYEVLDWLEILGRQAASLRSHLESLASWYFTLCAPPSQLNDSLKSKHNALCRESVNLRLDHLGDWAVNLEAFVSEVRAVHSCVASNGRSNMISLWVDSLQTQMATACDEANVLVNDILDLGLQCETELSKIDFRFLYDEDAHQMFIGYDVSSSQSDRHHYDLLASEARLASLIAIAVGQVPTKHWYHLGRPTARVSGRTALLSWSGTMFEYLMPLLFTRSFPKTLLGRSTKAAIKRQIQYARKHGVPWGISESAFATTDAKGDYQYRAFGTPGLGLKRGLEDDLVIAPYASLLAVGLRPRAVLDNLAVLRSIGAWGEYGVMEAVDFTKGRATTKRGAIVQAYMAHHQGMGLVALGNVLAPETMIERFHSDPRIQTVAHLLQERLPDETTQFVIPELSTTATVQTEPLQRAEPWKPDTQITSCLVDPALHVLSNGILTGIYDSFGHSGLSLGDTAVRPREFGAPVNQAGSVCVYMQIDGNRKPFVLSGALSASIESDFAERQVTFWPHKVETFARIDSVSVAQDVFIAAHDNVEIRQIRLTNDGREDLKISLCCYAEVAIQPASEYHRHPAFSCLFLSTSSRDQGRILVCRRRPRSPNDHYPVVAQAVIADDIGSISWDTSRSCFVGRGGSLIDPWALRSDGTLAGGEGHMLDPCLAQRVKITVPAGGSHTVAWITAVGADEERVLRLLSPHLHTSGLPATLEQCEKAVLTRIGTLGATATEIPSFQTLLSQLICRPRKLKHETTSRLHRQRLWGIGISGDRPMVVLHWRSENDRIVAQLLRAHQFLVGQRVDCDVVVVDHQMGGYLDEMRERFRQLAHKLGQPALHHDVTLVSQGQLSPEDLAALDTFAGAVVDTNAGEFAEQLVSGFHAPRLIPLFAASRELDSDEATGSLARPSKLMFDNGYGGFSPDGREYIVFLPSGSNSNDQTPAPWCNVLANPRFGCIVSERGFGCSWAHNASENRLTPWSNDPVCDPPSEVLYFRDEETGAVWTPTPGPKSSSLSYEIAHGIGYTRYRHCCYGLQQAVHVMVHPQEPVKVVALTIENLSDRPRRITATYFADWVLGTAKTSHGPFVIQDFDPDTRSLIATNSWNADYPDQVVFLATSDHVHGFTTDRVEFLGAGGLADPEALRRWGLSNTEVAGSQTCAALQVHLDIKPGQHYRLHFVVGSASGRATAIDLANRSIQATFVEETKAAQRQQWDRLLGRVHVSTTQPATDLMLNTWALYQTISSRLFARTGFYQSSGAIGFRDQLQDVMAVLIGAPELARSHILLAAAHQFDAGDVLHWWHPPHSQGVRTRCSDDLVWLPYTVSHYIEVTGDDGILDEQVPFLTGTELSPDEHDRYGRFSLSSETGSLFEHCLRALDRAYHLGDHGLPRIGSCDWNDGMNLVGAKGIGESVWLGWFLYATMQRFAHLCCARGCTKDSHALEERCHRLKPSLEAAWDGAWYRRAYYDDGTPLGSEARKEARIDSISQSWAVLSGAADSSRAELAVQSAVTELVDEDAQLIRLLWPPFDKDGQEPGYIKGYPPGVRENGAQYTHAATWLAWALAELGHWGKAEELFRYLNPILHASTREDARLYSAEPYVLAGDVYSIGSLRGRAGWSWYTGSAAWYWRLGIEQLLGCRICWPYLHIVPKVPHHWPRYQVELQLTSGSYDIEVVNPGDSYQDVVEATIDGKPLLSNAGQYPRIDLRAYQGHHAVRVVLGRVTQVPAKASR